MFIYSILIIFIDQFSKWCALNSLISFDFYYIKFELVKNSGISFGLFKNFFDFVFLITFFSILFFLKEFFYEKNLEKKFYMNVIISGGISNFIDRIFLKNVTDFIFIKIPFENAVIVNFADIFIAFGVIKLILLFFK